MESEKIEVAESNNRKELKHLGFVRVAAIHALVCVSNLYEYAKQNSGPLRSTVGTVEGAVTTVVAPVYEKVKGVPDDLLVFFDKKVDEASHKFDEHAPPLAKKVACQTHILVKKTSQKAHELVSSAQAGGLRGAVNYAASEYKHLLLDSTVKVCVGLNRVPTVHMVAEMAVPTAAHLSEKYNHTVKNLSQKGYAGFGYLPLVPIDEIAKAFKQIDGVKKADKKTESGSGSSESDSD